MRKKLLFVLAFLTISSALFAGGKDKLGVYIGTPLSLSYGHEFNDLLQIDLLLGWGFGYGVGAVETHLGLLFTLTDGVVDGHPWVLTLGPAVAGGVVFGSGLVAGAVAVLADLRWEIDFHTVKGFNLFLDLAPGVAFQFNTSNFIWYAIRAGLGLRYRFQ